MATEGGGGVVEELVENTTVIAVNVTDDSMLRPGEPVTRQVNCAIVQIVFVAMRIFLFFKVRPEIWNIKWA